MPHISIEQAIEDIRAGRMVILADGNDPESEGDFCLAAEKVTPQSINFMAKHGRGLICLSVTAQHAQRLDLPPMVTTTPRATAPVSPFRSTPAGNGLMISQMTDTFQMPASFASLVYLSMVLQAEGIRYGVEHLRRNRQRVSGTLIWQLNDCWPVASWASIDYFGRWKALHYAARRFYTPVLVSIEDQDLTMHVHVTSDLTTPFQGKVTWQLTTLDGAVMQSGEEPLSLAPLESRKITSPSFDLNPAQCRSVVFVTNLYLDGKLISTNLATYAPIQGMEDGPSGKVITAEVPLAEMFGYATSVRSMGQGRATFTMEFAKYMEVPNNVAEAVLKKAS